MKARVEKIVFLVGNQNVAHQAKAYATNHAPAMIFILFRFSSDRVIYVKNSKGYYPAKPCQTLLCIKFFSSIKHLEAFFEA